MPTGLRNGMLAITFLDLRIELAINEGVNNDRGNLLGIEPDLSPRDYQSLEAGPSKAGGLPQYRPRCRLAQR